MRLHVVDGTYELFRAHFSRRPSRQAPDGRDVKACHGLASTLLALLADPTEDVTHLAVAFDRPIESFRNDLFAGYKDSSGVDPALLAQLELAEQTVAALGICVWSMARYEADDALATAAVVYRNDFDQIRVLSPDKDLGQVVAGEHVVQVDRARDRIFDEQGVIDRLGVAPRSVPDYLALVGDAADGIPGLAGWGQRSTAVLLGAYGHIEAIPADAATWSVEVRGAQRLATTLSDHRDEALLYRSLATLMTDVDLSTAPDTLAFAGTDAARWLRWCETLGFASLAQRPARWAT